MNHVNHSDVNLERATVESSYDNVMHYGCEPRQ